MKKYFTVKMSNGDVYGVPAEVIAKNRADYYAPFGGEMHEREIKSMMHSFDTKKHSFVSWSRGYLFWDDVKDHAVLVSKNDEPVDFEDGWMNGEYGFLVEE